MYRIETQKNGQRRRYDVVWAGGDGGGAPVACCKSVLAAGVLCRYLNGGNLREVELEKVAELLAAQGQSVTEI